MIVVYGMRMRSVEVSNGVNRSSIPSIAFPATFKPERGSGFQPMAFACDRRFFFDLCC